MQNDAREARKSEHNSYVRAKTTHPGRRAWRGAAIGALMVFLALLISSAVGLYGPAGPLWVIIASTFFVIAFGLVGGLITLLWLLLKQLRPICAWIAASILGVVAFLTMVGLGVAIGIILTVIGATVAASLVGAGLALLLGPASGLLSKRRQVTAAIATVAGLIALSTGSSWLLSNGRPISLVPYPDEMTSTEILDLPDPSEPGPHAVRTLTYGSGIDRHRAAYGTEVAWKTGSVDGSALVKGWNRLRTAYWGFGPEALPRNARVWYPDGLARQDSGPFPLVLIVHGQHTMVDDSDVGYAYLGELLASRGMIVASVDENFLNLSPVHDLLFFSQLQDDGDLRGWLLLEHLQLWRTWTATPGHPFYGKVELDTIALIGHSRGGEAVAVAAAFNRLAAYPDDATLAFDYDFGIKSVIAFAPVDRMTEPAGQPIHLRDVSYLVLQGAHDMDVLTFFGSSQYNRTHLSPESNTFKAGLYIYGANHGQFNTAWGRKDFFEPVMRVYNLTQLMPGDAQRQVAKTAVSAFLEATLRGEEGYRAFFRDPRAGAPWLPETTMRTQYQDAATTLICTYEEDMDPTSTTRPGGRIIGTGLAIWREGRQMAKHESRDNQVAVLAWTDAAAGSPASYAIVLPEDSGLISGEATLVFAAADAGETPEPDGGAVHRPASHPIDLTIEIVDAAGNRSRLPLSAVAPIFPQLEGRLGKAAFFSPLPASEPVLQHYEFPLGSFAVANSAVDLSAVTEIRFVFDRTPAGSIMLDDIGVRNTGDAQSEATGN